MTRSPGDWKFRRISFFIPYGPNRYALLDDEPMNEPDDSLEELEDELLLGLDDDELEEDELLLDEELDEELEDELDEEKLLLEEDELELLDEELEDELLELDEDDLELDEELDDELEEDEDFDDDELLEDELLEELEELEDDELDLLDEELEEEDLRREELDELLDDREERLREERLLRVAGASPPSSVPSSPGTGFTRFFSLAARRGRAVPFLVLFLFFIPRSCEGLAPNYVGRPWNAQGIYFFGDAKLHRIAVTKRTVRFVTRSYNEPVNPYWLDEPYAPRAALEGEGTAEVAILGGGITGIAAAHFLASRGCRAAVVERDVIASGATGRNAGFLLAGVAHSYAVAIKSHGHERSRLLWRISRENHVLLQSLVEAENISCLYARNGSYTLALSEQEAGALAKSARLMKEDGFPVELLDDTDLARRFEGGGFRAGLFHPDDGEIHPVRFVRGLARAAERRGARLFERTPVTKIEQGADTVTLHTPKGRLSAAMLLLATNAYTPLLHPYFEGAIVGMRGQMFATEPCPRRIIPAPAYVDFGFEYFRQLPDGRILAGGGRRASLDTELTYADRPTDKVQDAIGSFLRSCFPAAAELKVTHRWAGIMGFSCDELPNIGPIPGSVNVYAAAGYHGHGLGFSVIAARAASEMILDGKTSVPCEIFSPRRHLSE